MSREEWLKRKEAARRGKTKRAKVRQTFEEEKAEPKVGRTFTWEEEQCPYCKEKEKVIRQKDDILHKKEEWIEELRRYTLQCEAVIRRRIGASYLPKRPPLLKNL